MGKTVHQAKSWEIIKARSTQDNDILLSRANAQKPNTFDQRQLSKFQFRQEASRKELERRGLLKKEDSSGQGSSNTQVTPTGQSQVQSGGLRPSVFENNRNATLFGN